MNLVFCKEWNNIRKKPHHVIPLEEARMKDENGEAYVVAMYDEDRLFRVLSFDKNSCTVRFYNGEQDGLYLMYGFVLKNDKLFLNAAYHYSYLDGKIIEHTLFSFDQDGKMIAEKMDYRTGEVEEREGIVDVSPNWEEIPTFGEYSSIIRKER